MICGVETRDGGSIGQTLVSAVLFSSLGLSNIYPGALRGAQQHGSVNNCFRGCINFKPGPIVFKLPRLLVASMSVPFGSIGIVLESTLWGRLGEHL